MLLSRIPRGAGASISALTIALGASLVAFFALLAPTAPPVEAIAGGRDATIYGGQVQYYTTPPGLLGTAPRYACTGTLISPRWVLTAKHCTTGSTPADSGVLAGSKQLGQGTAYALSSIHQNPSTDVALLELDRDANHPNLVVGYVGDSTPAVNQNVSIRGWGSAPGTAPRPVLQEATMRVHDTRWAGATEGNRLLLYENGQGVGEAGDSGAGIYAGGRIHAVYSTGNDFDEVSAVPTEDIAPWIQQVSGVAPSIYPALDTPNVPAEPPASAPASAPAEEEPPAEAPPVAAPPEEAPPEEASPEEVPPLPKPLEAGELEDLLDGIDADSLDSDEHAEELRKVVSERYPGHNVMVIQQETYDEPEDIQGVALQFSTDISPYDNGVVGVNRWDVWVFESGAFTNTGDLGYDNWVFSGNFERSGDNGETATFEPIEE